MLNRVLFKKTPNSVYFFFRVLIESRYFFKNSPFLDFSKAVTGPKNSEQASSSTSQVEPRADEPAVAEPNNVEQACSATSDSKVDAKTNNESDSDSSDDESDSSSTSQDDSETDESDSSGTIQKNAKRGVFFL